jgi:hypothetical protein
MAYVIVEPCIRQAFARNIWRYSADASRSSPCSEGADQVQDGPYHDPFVNERTLWELPLSVIPARRSGSWSLTQGIFVPVLRTNEPFQGVVNKSSNSN